VVHVSHEETWMTLEVAGRTDLTTPFKQSQITNGHPSDSYLVDDDAVSRPAPHLRSAAGDTARSGPKRPGESKVLRLRLCQG